jgi:hypothetical protein
MILGFYMDASVKIEGLPKNDKTYVIVNYEGILKNHGFAVDIPIVVVSLGEVQNNHLIKNALTCMIGLPELSIVRIGTMWKDQTRLDGYWNKYDKYVEDMQLTFDLKKTPAKLSRYKREEGVFEYSSFSAENLLQGDERDSQYGPMFTEFRDDNGIRYIVSSIELLMSTYLPRNKLIRNDLLLYDIDTVVDYYTSKHDNLGSSYEVTVDKSYEAETITFLAYLAENNTTRGNLSKIWTNLQHGNHTHIKHLAALPYHPEKISFEVSGLWIDKYTFYIQRINKPKAPNEIRIVGLVNKTASQPNNANHTAMSSPTKSGVVLNNEEIDKKTEISHTRSPSGATGVKYIVSEVSPDNSDLSLEIKENIENIIDASNSYSAENIEVENASSGKMKSDKNSEKTARTKYIIEKNPQVIKSSAEIINALLELTRGDTPKIKCLKYIDDYAKEYDSLIYCSFAKKHINMNENKYWASGYVRGSGIKRAKSGYRKLLIAKITIEGVKSIYLLEIVRKVKRDSFFGVIFQLPIDLDFDVLEDIKDVIASNKGHFVGKNILQFPVKKAVRIKHKWGAMKQRFENVFDVIKEKKIFD